MRLTCDCWRGTRKDLIVDPSWEDIASLIDSMDGDHIDSVILSQNSEDHYLGIGGGEDGIYICFIAEGNKYYRKWDNNKPDGTMEINVGGQPGDFPIKMQCDIVSIKEIAKYYYCHSERNPQYDWKPD